VSRATWGVEVLRSTQHAERSTEYARVELIDLQFFLWSSY
jgi:hypothetical protein